MSEHLEQKALFEWAEYMKHQYPPLALLFAIPNGGYRPKGTAVRIKAEGVKAGVPDICLPWPSGPYHGLYIELKTKRGRVGNKQRYWIEQLLTAGYQVRVCYGWEEASRTILDYLQA